MGGMHDGGCVCSRGVCMAEGGMHGKGVCVVGGACVAGVMHGRGVCMVGGVHGRGHEWQGGLSGTFTPWHILQDTVNEWAVCILLECILV